MEMWTKVRVANGNAGDDCDNQVWQGFYAGNNMGGADVYVTADTLRRFVDAVEAEQDEWDRLNNPYTSANESLAFGTGAVKVPGTKVVVYPLFDMALEVVQRFDPTAGKTYSHRHADGTVTMEPYGAWVNVAPILGNPKPMGFVINEQDYAEGRSGDQPFLRVRVEEPEPPKPPYTDHDGNRTDDPRCELGLCVACNDDALARLEAPNPALSVTSPEYVTDSKYRARVHDAFHALGVEYRDS